MGYRDICCQRTDFNFTMLDNAIGFPITASRVGRGTWVYIKYTVFANGHARAMGMATQHYVLGLQAQFPRGEIMVAMDHDNGAPGEGESPDYRRQRQSCAMECILGVTIAPDHDYRHQARSQLLTEQTSFRWTGVSCQQEGFCSEGVRFSQKRDEFLRRAVQI